MISALWFYLAAMCAARYRTKDEIDLAWNKVRRQVTRDIDTVFQNYREEVLNDALGTAWDRFQAELETGTTVHLEDRGTAWVKDMIHQHLQPKLGVAHGPVDEG